MKVFDLKVVVVTQCQMFSLPIIREAVAVSYGKIVGVELDLNTISLNRNIRRNEANLLILTIDEKKMICSLISAIKKNNPSIKIITIALSPKQIPLIVRTRMIRAIIVANEGIDHLIEAIKRVTINKSYYSPKTSEAMAQEIALASLTSREKDVIHLLEENKSRKEIATILKIRPVTVNTHIRNINFKIS